MRTPRVNVPLNVMAIIPTILLAFTFSCCPPCKIQENFVLAYVNEANQIVVRSMEARTGTAWSDGKFPTDVQAGLGVGLAADTVGLIHIIFANEKVSANVKMVWGLGPAVWDKSAVSTPAMIPVSSISAVSLGGDRWLVAYQQTGGTIFAGIYDSATRHFLGNIAPMGPLNSHIDGRPSVARSHNTVVITWRHWNGEAFDLVAAAGKVQDGSVLFDAPRVVPTPRSGELGVGITGDPVVTTNLGAFYVLVVRREIAHNSWRAQLIGSNDGVDWRLLTVAGALDVNDRTYLAAAGASNGKILVASLRYFSTDRAIPSAVLYGNGSWTSLNDAQVADMFGGYAALKPFTLIDSKP